MSAFLREQLHDSAKHVQPLGDIDRAITSGVQRRNRTLAAAAVVGVGGTAVLAAVLLGASMGSSQPEPLRPPAPSPASDVNGWPTTRRNAPGDYSLDGDRCGVPRSGGQSCNVGWMHNGYGSGDVDIQIQVGSDIVISDEGGTTVSIAGYEGTHRQITARQEDWTVDIEGTPMAINLVAAPGASQADVTEAHAIIDSMRTEPRDNDVGFRVVFTVTTDDWDSG